VADGHRYAIYGSASQSTPSAPGSSRRRDPADRVCAARPCQHPHQDRVPAARAERQPDLNRRAAGLLRPVRRQDHLGARAVLRLRPRRETDALAAGMPGRSTGRNAPITASRHQPHHRPGSPPRTSPWPSGSRSAMAADRCRLFPAAKMSSAARQLASTCQFGCAYFVPMMQRARPGFLTLPS
jgi:hypothetical protein